MTLVQELKWIAIGFAISYAAIALAFYKENMLVSLRFTVALFWLFVLPGYFLLLFWKDKFSLLERIVMGSLLSAGILGIASYYFGLLGLSVIYHAALLPLILVCAGMLFSLIKAKSTAQNQMP